MFHSAILLLVLLVLGEQLAIAQFACKLQIVNDEPVGDFDPKLVDKIKESMGTTLEQCPVPTEPVEYCGTDATPLSGDFTLCEIPTGTMHPGTTTTTTYSHCAKGCLDMVIVMDESISISNNDFKKGLDASADLVEKLDIGAGPTQSRVGYVCFSTTARVIFGLTTCKTQAEAQKLIQEIVKKPGSTNIAAGMQAATNQVCKQAPRPGGSTCKRVMVVITDGFANIEQNLLPQRVNEATAEGITVYAIGVGGEPKEAELNMIAGSPERVMRVSDYSVLSDRLKQVIC